MKRKINVCAVCGVLMALLLTLGMIMICSCGGGSDTPAVTTPADTSSADVTTTDDTTAEKTTAAQQAPEIVDAGVFTLEGTTLSLTVEADNQYFDFNGRIKVAAGNTWSIFSDKEGSDPVANKSAKLEYGENVYYIIVKSGDESLTYTVKITRQTPPETEPPVTLPQGQYEIGGEGIGDVMDFPVN